MKRFNLTRSFWGVNAKIRVHRHIFKQILQLCGRFLTHIDLSKEDISFRQTDDRICIQSCKYNFSVISELCPNITSINAGCPCTDTTIQYIANHFNNLTHFGISFAENDYEDAVSLVFLNNKNLKQVDIEGGFFTGKCLLNLNFGAFEKLQLQKVIIRSLQHFLNVSII